MRSPILGTWLLLATLSLIAVRINVADPVTEPLAPPPDLPAADLGSRIDQVLDRVRARTLDSESSSPWEVLHAIIAFERSSAVKHVPTDERLEAVEYLLHHATYEGQRLLREVDEVATLPQGSEEMGWVETHRDQFLMGLADADVPPETEWVMAGGRRIQIGELVEQSKRRFRVDQELGWTLVTLATYGNAKESWSNDRGEEQTLVDLVERAIYRDPRMETEGGHHHLYGVAYAVDRHMEEGGEAGRIWLKARFYLDNFIAHAKAYQQSDGAFSAAGFRGSRPPTSPEIDLQETGHTLEWLVLALPTPELEEPWVLRAVVHLCDLLESHSLDSFSPGALYHAAHGLRLYRERVLPKAELSIAP